MNIGNARDGQSRFWEGWIDEVAVWDRVLAEEEIQWLQNNAIVAIPEINSLAMLLITAAFVLVQRRARVRG